MTDNEFLRFLKEHPELWGVVMDVLKNALAAPQHAHGPHSDARNQRNPPGEILHRLAAPHPAQHRQENAQHHPARP